MGAMKRMYEKISEDLQEELERDPTNDEISKRFQEICAGMREGETQEGESND